MINNASYQPLANDISNKIRRLCQQGYKHYDSDDLKTAIRVFYSAWTLLPKPQSQWLEAGWILTALGDAYIAKSEFKNAKEALLSALHCPATVGNPVIHLRLGQCHYELGENDAAQEQFKLTINNGGEALFYQQDNKYQVLLTAK
ncbi:MAG: hypothetical protein WCY88_02060 [Spongiibacteraceae bacterium]